MIYPSYYPQSGYMAPYAAQAGNNPMQANNSGCGPNSGIIWVQGEAGAKSYLVQPNNTVALWDSEAQTIYLKSADASGMPSMKVIDYTIREQAPGHAHAGVPGYATRDELQALRRDLDQFRGQLETLLKEAGDE